MGYIFSLSQSPKLVILFLGNQSVTFDDKFSLTKELNQTQSVTDNFWKKKFEQIIRHSLFTLST